MHARLLIRFERAAHEMCCTELGEAQLSVDEGAEASDDPDEDSSAVAQLPEHHYNMSPSAIVSLLLLNLAPT